MVNLVPNKMDFYTIDYFGNEVFSLLQSICAWSHHTMEHLSGTQCFRLLFPAKRILSDRSGTSERSLFTDALRFKDERGGASLLSQLESLHGVGCARHWDEQMHLGVMGKFSAFHKNPSCGRGMEFLLLNVEIVKRDISYTTQNGILRCHFVLKARAERTPLSLSSFALVLFLPRWDGWDHS